MAGKYTFKYERDPENAYDTADIQMDTVSCELSEVLYQLSNFLKISGFPKNQDEGLMFVDDETEVVITLEEYRRLLRIENESN